MDLSWIKSKLATQFEQLEREHQELRKSAVWIHVIFGSLIVIIVLLSFYIDRKLVVLFLIAFAATMWYFFHNRNKNKSLDLFKDTVLVPAFKLQYPDLSYTKNGFDKADFLASGIFDPDQVDRYGSEDLFEGMHGKTAFRFSEVLAERKESDGEGGTNYETIFEGVYMIADFNKYLKAETKVLQTTDSLFEKFKYRKTKVKLENEVFERLFNTYSNDEVEARYILTPRMMERILGLQDQWNDRIYLSFRGNHIYIAINHQMDLFEANLDRTLDEKQLIHVFQQVERCLSIIDALDLNTRIWTKE